MSEEATWPVHDRIMGIQASILTSLMNSTTLRRVYDNEFRVAAEKDMITLSELFDTISSAIWGELDSEPPENCSARQPMISSLRRNLQREHLDRLIDLSLPDAGYGAAYKPISNLSLMKIRELKQKLGRLLPGERPRAAEVPQLDPYTRAHLAEAWVRIEKALDAQYIYNANDIGGGASVPYFFFKETERGEPRK